jgi:hypothetical protein
MAYANGPEFGSTPVRVSMGARTGHGRALVSPSALGESVQVLRATAADLRRGTLDYAGPSELGFSLKPSRSIRNVASKIGKVVVPAAVGFATGGPAGAVIGVGTSVAQRQANAKGQAATGQSATGGAIETVQNAEGVYVPVNGGAQGSPGGIGGVSPLVLIGGLTAGIAALALLTRR